MSVAATPTSWRRSKRCDTNACVEVTLIGRDTVALRDSKDPEGPVLHFSRQEWDAFVAGIGEGDFAFE